MDLRLQADFSYKIKLIIRQESKIIVPKKYHRMKMKKKRKNLKSNHK